MLKLIYESGILNSDYKSTLLILLRKHYNIDGDNFLEDRIVEDNWNYENISSNIFI